MVFLHFLEANSSNLYTRRKKETIWEQIIYANESGLKLYGVAWCCQAIIVNVGLHLGTKFIELRRLFV